jgi:hypothetical protein
MPLAKSAPPNLPTPEAPPVAIVPPPTGLANFEWQGIPIDVCRMFGVELTSMPSRDLEQLRGISEWAKEKVGPEGSIGDILSAISKVQRELGAPRINERAYAKVAEFVKMQKVIDEMRKRQDSMKAGSWL